MKVGDKVIVTGEGSVKYTVTKEGSYGKIIRIGGNTATIDFEYTTGNDNRPFPIDIKYLKLMATAKPDYTIPFKILSSHDIEELQEELNNHLANGYTISTKPLYPPSKLSVLLIAVEKIKTIS